MPRLPSAVVYVCICISVAERDKKHVHRHLRFRANETLEVRNCGEPVHIFDGLPVGRRGIPEWYSSQKPFEMDELHRLYIARHAPPESLSDAKWNYFWVAGFTKEMCGTELFSKPAENCGAVDANTTQAGIDELIEGMGEFAIPRKFGIEFEFVTRSENLNRAKECFAQKVTATFNGLWGKDCSTSADCDIQGWSMQGWAVCTAEKKCRPFSDVTCKSRDDYKKLPCSQMWKWDTDAAIGHLGEDDLKEKGVNDTSSEMNGYPLELISPFNPLLEGTIGLRKALWTLILLRDQGVQAPKSVDLHMHVDAIGLTPVQLHNIWANYARFQFVIAEMTADAKINNIFQKLMLMSSSGVRNIYSQMHKLSKSEGANDRFQDKNTTQKKAYCETIIRAWSTLAAGNTCSGKDAYARGLQVNINPLPVQGSIEFRAFPGTHNPKRFLEWIVFVHRFLNKYQDHDIGLLQVGDAEAAKQLEDAQYAASLDDLEGELGVDMSYWKRRPWLDNDPSCQWKPRPN